MPGKKGMQSQKAIKITDEKKPVIKNQENLMRGGGKKTGELTDGQIMFAHEYCLDFSKSAAALRAGFSTKNPGDAGNKLYKMKPVKALIDSILAQRAEENEHLHERIREELKLIAFSDITDIMQLTKKERAGATDDVNGVVFKPSEIWEKGRGRLVKSMKIGRKGVEIALHDKGEALRQLALHTGFYKEPEDIDSLEIVIKKRPNG